MADAAVVARQAEVQADGLGVADVQVAVGLGREAGADPGRVQRTGGVMRRVARAAAEVARRLEALFQVALDDGAQEVAGLDGGVRLVGRGSAGGLVVAGHRYNQWPGISISTIRINDH